MNFMNSISNKRLIAYVAIAITCVIVIGIAVYFQFFYSKDIPINWNGNSFTEESEEARDERLRTEFNLVFSNSVRKNSTEEKNIQRVDATKDVVYTLYRIDLYSEDKYDVNLNIPYLNIDHDVARKINKEIDNLFGSKANTVVQSKESLSIYNLDYVAYLNDDILSIVIKATLKEQDFPQRVIIKTYNYDVLNNKELSLGALLLRKKLDKTSVYNKVMNEIDTVIKENEALAQEGYEVFKRERNDTRYLLENTDTFFIDQNNYLYLIYAYGNNNFTNEFDMVIF